MKKNILFLLLFVFTLIDAYSQSSYSVSSNRIIMSTLVNNDTLLIENRKNNVRINGQMELLEIEYHHMDSRIINQKTNETRTPELDFVVLFSNEYSWIDDRVKTSVNEQNFTDDINIEIEGEVTEVPIDIKIYGIQGARQVFTVLMEFSGVLSPEPLEKNFPELEFHNEIPFRIILTIEVSN